MTSLIEVHSNEGESILPEVEELTEFHPDQLSSLVDIQDELAKLEGRQDVAEDVEMSTMDDVNVVDHEVTIIAEQENEEMSILPDITEMDHHSEIALEDKAVSIADSVVNSNVEESLVVGETITIGVPNASATKVVNQIHGSAELPKLVPIKPAGPIPVQFAPGVSHLKAIRPLPEGLRGKKPYMTMTQSKKNVLTKVIFSQNSQMTSDSPIIFGEAGQAIRIVGAQNKTVTANSPKTITLAQAREMGLLSPGKVILPNQSKGVVKQGVVMSGNKTVTMLKSSPTKILPLPTSGQLHSIASTQGISGPPQKIFIRQSSAGLKAGTFTGTILASSSGTQGQFLQIPVSQDGTNQIHQIQLPGKQVQYVRLVNSSSAGSSISDTAVTARQPVPVALTSVSTVPQFKMMPITSTHSSAATPQVQVQAQAGSSFERVLVSPGLSQLAARSEGKPTNNVVMVPAEFVKQYTPPVSGPTTVSMPSSPSPPMLTVHAPVVSTPAPSPSPTMSLPPTTKSKEAMLTTPAPPPPPPPRKTSAEPPNGIRPRKPCNCTKSQCLKLVSPNKENLSSHSHFLPCSSTNPDRLRGSRLRYCDCFANGEFCFQCNCNCCYNNLDHEEERQRAIKACLERNPNAFRPKIGKGYIGDERRHNKGCNCKRSGCLKNYCECYEAKIPCSNNCKCVGCRNVEEAKHIHDRTSGDGGFQTNKLNKLSSDMQETSLKPTSFPPSQGNRQPFNLMTQEVVEATCQCLLGQVEGDEMFTDHVERLIIQEFGRCLVEIIQCATRTTSAVNNNPT